MQLNLRSLRKDKKGWTIDQLADVSGLSRGYISQLENGKRQPGPDTITLLCEILGCTPSELIADYGDDGPIDAVAVPGFVGAGAEVYLSDPYPKGEGMYKVACPPQLSPHGIVAVEVRGESMEPVFSEGDLLFYTRNGDHGVPTEAIGRKCVAETEDGKVWIKQLKIGTAPGLFNLLSINPVATNMLDVRVKWAAPVRLHLPKEFVKRLH